MNKLIRILPLAVAIIATSALTGCDTAGEQNFGWTPGETLAIAGPSEITAGETGSYFVRAYTIEQDYTWNVDGGTLTTRRDGEYADVTIDEPGAYTLTVSNGDYEGSRTINVVEPEDDEE